MGRRHVPETARAGARNAERVARRSFVGAMSRLPPSWTGYRWVRREPVRHHQLRKGPSAGSMRFVHEAAVAQNPLPENIDERFSLPDDRGWWGYSFRDVPERRTGPTVVHELRDCTITWYCDPNLGGDFHPAILSADHRSLDLREIRFRRPHASVLRSTSSPVELPRATWVLERVYDNHSHWLTAHLPKLLLLAQHGRLDDVVLPRRCTEAMASSLDLVGLDPGSFPTFDPTRPLHVQSLTVVESDRFRPELLRMAQEALGPPAGATGDRRVYISRREASRRRLRNEDEIWPELEVRGFERVVMEHLSFAEQVELMRSTRVVVAPHGAGLTNMLFCPPGARIVEIADLGFPNPNFYAMAVGLGHRYWIVDAPSVGGGHRLQRDLRVGRAALTDALDAAVGG